MGAFGHGKGYQIKVPDLVEEMYTDQVSRYFPNDEMGNTVMVPWMVFYPNLSVCSTLLITFFNSIHLHYSY